MILSPEAWLLFLAKSNKVIIHYITSKLSVTPKQITPWCNFRFFFGLVGGRVAFLEVFFWHFSNSFKNNIYFCHFGHLFSFSEGFLLKPICIHIFCLLTNKSRFFRKENFNFSSFCSAVIWNKWDMGKIEKSEFCHKSWFQSVAVILLKWQIIIWFQEESNTVVWKLFNFWGFEHMKSVMRWHQVAQVMCVRM